MIQYDVFVDEEECKKPNSLAQFQSSFRGWCKKMAAYQNSVTKWQSWYDQNAHCPRNTGFVH
ncbi:hypothetical protein AB6A40_011095 [Gnathostoma spinigerum]|uniref:Uncharacterized protein n=1 Tax=Gnathostoma spinigerum TaxID=75299 RepID=A0ABD6F2D8_9BILA